MQWTVLVKNLSTTADVFIEDLGINIPAEGEITLSNQFSPEEISGSGDLSAKALASDLVVNDGLVDLTAAQAVKFLSFETVYAVERDYYSKTELQGDGTAAVHWNNLTNIPSFGSPVWANPIECRVTALSATPPSSPAAKDFYANSTDHKIYQWVGGQWVEYKTPTTGMRVIVLSDADQSIATYNGSTWALGGATTDNTGVLVNNDNDGNPAQYVYDSENGNIWIKIGDYDFTTHLDNAPGKHTSEQIATTGSTYHYVATGDTVEEAIVALDSTLNTAKSSIDTHLNGLDNKHDASEVDVEGTYTYIPVGSAETAFSSVDSALVGLDGRIDTLESSTGTHLNGGPSKHDATEIDAEGPYTHLTAGTLESVLGQIDTDLATALVQNLDKAYDGGRTINTDAGAIKLDTGSATNAPLEIVPKASLPSTGLADGQIAVKNGYLCIYDGARAKWLSTARFFVVFGRNGNSSNQYLNFFGGSLASNNSGVRMARNATIVSMSGQLDANGTCTLGVRKNDVASDVASLSISAATGAQIATTNVDIAAGDFLQSYVSAVTAVADPMFVVELAWRM